MGAEESKAEQLLLKNQALSRRVRELELQISRDSRLADIGRVSSTIAHELRGPVGTIRAFAEMLPQRFDDPAFRQSFVEVVCSEADRLSCLVNRMLDLARPSIIESETFSLRKWLLQVIQSQSAVLEKNGCPIRLRGDVPDVLLKGDPFRLTQVLGNLLGNACEASEKGEEVTVGVTAWENPDPVSPLRTFAKIEVRDRGSGIDEENLQAAFEPFFTTKEKGTGLGLAIARKIVIDHEGEISLESELGRGTCVTLLLPLADQTSTASPTDSCHE